MKKSIVKLGVSLAATLMIGSSAVGLTSVKADDVSAETVVSDNQSLDSETDKHVTFDKASNGYIVDQGYIDTLSVNDAEYVKENISLTNQQIAEAKQDPSIGNVTVVDGLGTTYNLKTELLRSYGKNAIKFHWNYARIWINRDTLRTALQAGFAIGGIYAPARIVQAACAVLGIGSSYITSGIWFDYNYLQGIWTGNAGLQ